MAYTNKNFTWDFDALKRFYEKYIVKWLNSAVAWTEAQKKQARANLGFGDGDIDNEPTVGSNNLVKSGGVYKGVREIVDSYNTLSSDLDVADDNGNVLMRLKDGHIKIKNFDSSKDATTEKRGLMSSTDKVKLNSVEEGAQVNDVNTDNTLYADLKFSDEAENTLVEFKNGHIKTKNFDSADIKYYANRPATGYENFLVDVNNALEDNNSTTKNLQDSVDIRQDRCFLALPVNYSPTGNPIRLIIVSPGSNTKITSASTTFTMVPHLNAMLAEGFAVLTANGTPGYTDGIVSVGGMCTPAFLKSIQVAYNYVINKYNIRRDGVLLSGYSQGTAEVWQIAANKAIPVKAMTLFGPCVDIWKLMYAHGNKDVNITTLDSRVINQREWMCEQFGFVEKVANSYVLDIFSNLYNQGDIVTKPTVFSAKDTCPNDYEFAYILNNYETWLGYNPISWGTSKNIIGEQFRYRNWVTVQDPNEDLCFKDVANIVPCPLKMFTGTADVLTPPKIVNWYKTMADNAGMMCHVRTYQDGTHSYTSQYPTIQVQTKYGGTITTNITSWEGMLFLERYD